MITMAGTIGAGKSSLTKILSEELNTKAFYEPVANNPILPLFYKGNQLVEEEKTKTNPYAFLLQVYFLNKRFKMIKEAMQQSNNILDRSIYEDSIFMRMNYEEGHVTKEEWNTYQSLLKNMMEELPYAAHKKSPDLMIMIKVSYETMIARIQKRGRQFEQVKDIPSLKAYYQDLLAHYEQWVNEYTESPLMIIDGDKYDFVENENDRKQVVYKIEKKLLDLGKIGKETFLTLQQKQNADKVA